MAKEQKREKVLSWLREHPELLEKLDLMRQMEEDGLDSDFDRIELEMLELVKSMGASSLGRCVEAKQSKAQEASKRGGACRAHSKKN
jgi:hypothetical protein